MEPKSVKVSLYFQIVHELYVAARDLRRENVEVDELYQGIKTVEKQKTKTLSRHGMVLIVAAIIVSNISIEGKIPVKVGPTSIEIPEVYVAFAGAYAWATVLMVALQISTLLGVQAAIEFSRGKLPTKRFLQARSFIKGDDSFDALSPFRVSHFFSLSAFYRGIIVFLAAFFIMILVVISVGLYYSLFSACIEAIKVSTDVYMEDIIALLCASTSGCTCVVSNCLLHAIPNHKR